MPKLSDRVHTFTDSVIRRMTRISDEHGALNLSQGFPDFDPPKPILDALAKVAYEGPHQYPITFGAENFRQALGDRPGNGTGGHLRRHRGHDVRHDDHLQSRRQGAGFLSLL